LTDPASFQVGDIILVKLKGIKLKNETQWFKKPDTDTEKNNHAPEGINKDPEGKGEKKENNELDQKATKFFKSLKDKLHYLTPHLSNLPLYLGIYPVILKGNFQTVQACYLRKYRNLTSRYR